jgi:hypothetical protein
MSERSFPADCTQQPTIQLADVYPAEYQFPLNQDMETEQLSAMMEATNGTVPLAARE